MHFYSEALGNKYRKIVPFLGYKIALSKKNSAPGKDGVLLEVLFFAFSKNRNGQEPLRLETTKRSPFDYKGLKLFSVEVARIVLSKEASCLRIPMNHNRT
jgi:hypothetical protein